MTLVELLAALAIATLLLVAVMTVIARLPRAEAAVVGVRDKVPIVVPGYETALQGGQEHERRND